MITIETKSGKKIVIGDGKNKFEKMDLDRLHELNMATVAARKRAAEADRKDEEARLAKEKEEK